MPNQFICPNHRQWLITHPQAAATHLARTQDTAMHYRELGEWHEAVAYNGCAFETAEIILTTKAQDNLTAIIGFTSAAILLADTYSKLSENALSLNTLKLAQQRLQTEYALLYDAEHTQRCLLDCIKALNSGANALIARKQLVGSTPSTDHLH